jgi:putative peptidoglycan lipid II flippase
VNDSVQRVFSVALLVSSLMVAASLPLIDLVFRRGQLQFSDSETTAVYFSWFAVSLAFWVSQGLYARAFYAAGNTLTPMIASTVITLASLPVYALLFREFSAHNGVVGLVLASDLGIAANCIVTAILLHRRGLVSAYDLNWSEIAKALIIATAAALAGIRVSSMISLHGSRIADLKTLVLVFLTWAIIVAAGLWLLKSSLPRDLRRRRRGVGVSSQ